MKRRRRPGIIKIIALLLAWLVAGAALNVAVAWELAVHDCSVGRPDTTIEIQQWPRPAPADFPPPQQLESDGKLGHRHLCAAAQSVTPKGAPPAIWMQTVHQCGLPTASLEWVSHHASQLRDSWKLGGGIKAPTWLGAEFHERLPTTAIWPGFAINTLFYAGVLWVLLCGPFALRRMIRRHRGGRGRCPACAYPIGQSPVCTECGAEINYR